jgi:23S rRNA (guanosine2251-2'-O)-methyltransferase
MTRKDSYTENFLPGLKPVLELLEREPERVDMVYIRKGRVNAESNRLLDLCRDYGVRFNLVGDEILSRMAVHTGHQGVIARLRDASFLSWEDFILQAAQAPLPLIVALDQVQDPGNVGTLARTLFAMGGAGLVLPRHNSAFLGPGARRSAAGALERLPLTQVTNLSRAVKDARDAGFICCAAQKVSDSINPLTEKLPLPALLVLGNEEKGIRPGVLKHCDTSLCIPFLREFDSLNVAQAGAILISCFARSLN